MTKAIALFKTIALFILVMVIDILVESVARKLGASPNLQGYLGGFFVALCMYEFGMVKSYH